MQYLQRSTLTSFSRLVKSDCLATRVLSILDSCDLSVVHFRLKSKMDNTQVARQSDATKVSFSKSAFLEEKTIRDIRDIAFLLI